MRLRAGARYYEREDVEILVRDKNTGFIGRVTRATPAGNHIPAQAHVLFGSEDSGYDGKWIPARDLERVG